MSRKLIAAVVAVVVSAATIAGCSAGGGTEDKAVSATATTAAQSGGASLAEEAAAPAQDAVAVGDRDAQETIGGPANPSGPRVIQTASLRVSVVRGRFEEAVDEARTIVAGLGGFVTASTATQGSDQRLVRGTLVLRVPGPAYSRAMSALAKLGRVESREEAGEDVSAQFVDLEARKRHLEAVESQLLEFLERTTTVREALAVQSRLDDVQLQLEETRGQLRYLGDQTALATITLEIGERGVPAASPSDGGWGIGDAWHSAVRGLEKVAGGLFVAVVTAGPLLLALLLIGLSGRALLRRRRGRDGDVAAGARTPSPRA